MSSAINFLNVLRELYPEQAEDCIDSRNENRLLVYEGDDSRSYIMVQLEQEAAPHLGLLVHNDNYQSIYLLAIDACFWGSDGPTRCDCLVFNDEYLCFVELKLNVAVRRQATDKLNDARRQLGESIVFFKTNILAKLATPTGYKLEAYAVMQDTVYPRNRAARQTIFVRFLEQYGVALFETNVKSF